MRQDFFQHVREVFEDDNRFGSGVFELVFQFARSVQGIDVDDNHAGAEDAKNGDGILQEIGHHQRDAGALGETEALQPGGKVKTQAVELSVSDGGTEIAEGGQIPEFLAAL